MNELADWIDWMKDLPIHLDIGQLRVVHACWDDRHLRLLRDTPLRDSSFLHDATTEGTPEFKAVEVTLKGPEFDLPDGVYFMDKNGIKRKNVRVR